jgi:hypothetical protein
MCFQNVRGMRLEHTSRSGRGTTECRGRDTMEAKRRLPSLVPLFSFRRAPCGGRADIRPQRGCHQFPAVAPCDSGGPASACQIMTIQSRCNKSKRLVNLESDDCRWPLGDPREPHFRFCGALQLPGYPYCERHRRIAFQPAKPRYHQPVAVGLRSARAA